MEDFARRLSFVVDFANRPLAAIRTATNEWPANGGKRIDGGKEFWRIPLQQIYFGLSPYYFFSVLNWKTSAASLPLSSIESISMPVAF